MGAITSTGYTPARLRNSYQGVLEIDIGTHPQAAQDGGVLATPTTLVTRDGVVVEVVLGASNLRRAKALRRQG